MNKPKKPLPRRLAQARSQYYAQRRVNDHQDCEKITRRRGPHLGLYCAQHGTWICWIPQGLQR